MRFQQVLSLLSVLKSSARLYGSHAAAKSKSPLALLRQKTGFPIGKCREALTRHNENVEVAETWLYSEAQKEGWAKVEKLKHRTAYQGLIGVLIRRRNADNQALMVEVNCETDFVARNDKFKHLVSAITETTFNNKMPMLLTDTPMPVVDYLSKDVISAIQASTEQSLADKVAESVGQLAENIIISRGVSMVASRGLVCGFVYNSVSAADSQVQLGTYGALLHMLPEDNSNSDSVQAIGEKICQHVVGMDVSEAGGERDLVGLLSEQSFLFDSSITVGELLAKNKVTLTKVIRYALGGTDALF